jgi:hypothetical protein
VSVSAFEKLIKRVNPETLWVILLVGNGTTLFHGTEKQCQQKMEDMVEGIWNETSYRPGAAYWAAMDTSNAGRANSTVALLISALNEDIKIVRKAPEVRFLSDAELGGTHYWVDRFADLPTLDYQPKDKATLSEWEEQLPPAKEKVILPAIELSTGKKFTMSLSAEVFNKLKERPHPWHARLWQWIVAKLKVIFRNSKQSG